MRAPERSNQYALGSAAAEHERLIRQANWLAPHTERLFREAGIGPGQRVLDLGCGVGDVSLILARLVGPSGQVVGIDREPRSIARARARAAENGLTNTSFTQSDVSALPPADLFDAAVGRYILLFLPDPVYVLRSLSRLLRAGGVLAFQEPDWELFLTACERAPLWRAAAALMVETFRRSGTNTEMGVALAGAFERAGLPTPTTHSDVLVGAERWMPDVLHSLRPNIQALELPLAALGDFATLWERLQAEASARMNAIPLPSLVSAWARIPAAADGLRTG